MSESAEEQELADLLRRDAEKLEAEAEACFDPSLHRDAIRQIRQVRQEGATGTSHAYFRLLGAPAVLAVAALVLVMLIGKVVFWPEPVPGPNSDPAGGARPEVAGTTVPPHHLRASALAYRRAVVAGEDALFDLLDRDARTLLPRSSSVFETNR